MNEGVCWLHREGMLTKLRSPLGRQACRRGRPAQTRNACPASSACPPGAAAVAATAACRRPTVLGHPRFAGKTTITSLLGGLLASKGQRVILVDGDPQMR